MYNYSQSRKGRSVGGINGTQHGGGVCSVVGEAMRPQGPDRLELSSPSVGQKGLSTQLRTGTSVLSCQQEESPERSQQLLSAVA